MQRRGLILLFAFILVLSIFSVYAQEDSPTDVPNEPEDDFPEELNIPDEPEDDFPEDDFEEEDSRDDSKEDFEDDYDGEFPPECAAVDCLQGFHCIRGGTCIPDDDSENDFDDKDDILREAEEEFPDAQLPDAGVTPDSFFYFFDTIFEGEEMAKKRSNLYAKYIPMIAEFCTELAGKKKEPDYQKILEATNPIEPEKTVEKENPIEPKKTVEEEKPIENK